MDNGSIMNGVVSAISLGIISHIVAKVRLSKGKNPGQWDTAWKFFYWIGGVMFFADSLIVQSGDDLLSKWIFVIIFSVVALVCWKKRKESVGWKIGFWVCLLFTVPNSIHLLMHLFKGI